MNERNRTLVFLAGTAMMLLSGCAAPMRATRLKGTGGASPIRGATYFLPRTVVTVDVPVVRTRWSPGRHSDLLPHFFPCLENSANADPRPLAPPACGAMDGSYVTNWTRFDLDDPVVGAKPERDPDQMFIINYQSRWFQWFVDRKFGIELNEDGIAGKVSGEATDHTVEVIGQVLKSAATVYGKALTGGILSSTEDVNAAKADPKECPGQTISNVQASFARYLQATDKDFFCSLPSAARDQYMIMPQGLQSAFRTYAGPIAKPNSPRVLHFLNGWEVFKRIGEAARKRENLLVDSTNDRTLEVFAARLKSVDDGIAADVGDFFGTTRQKTIWTGRFEIRTATPGASAASDAVASARAASPGVEVFGLDENLGICTVPPPAGIVDISSTAPTRAGQETGVECKSEPRVTVRLTSAATVPGDLAASGKNSGFFYRIPGTGEVEVLSGGSRLVLQKLSIAQFGAVAALPASTGGRKSAVAVELFATTGGLKTMTVTSDAALDKSLIGDAETAAGAVVDAKAAKKTAERSEELGNLEKQRKILEEKVKIKDLQEKLSGTGQSGDGQQ